MSRLTGLSKKGGSTFFHDYKLLSTVIRRRIHYLTVPLLGTKKETDWPVVSWVFLFPLFKNGILFHLF